jgi:hypothetical protein
VIRAAVHDGLGKGLGRAPTARHKDDGAEESSEREGFA